MSPIFSRLSLLCLFSFLNLIVLATYLYLQNMSLLMDWLLLCPLVSPIQFQLIFDMKGVLFAAMVSLISASVMYFASSYMSYEAFPNRFAYMVVLFIMSMIFLIFIPHMMCLLLGWDGLGIVSFALVIYYQNPKSLGAGMLTALTNRIGDVMLLTAIALSINQGHWLITLMTLNSYEKLLMVLILLAAMTKSAQIPFSSWLPAAMAAPTPVSALVHSSTLVTAGVFLLIRFYPFISTFSLFHSILLLSSTLTMLMASAVALMETDMKKIIALSTLSQLGVMMMSLALHLDALTFFHLLSHALFKALLFITAGAIIHLSLHSQDLRTTSNTHSLLPMTLSCMLTANAALMGIPFLAGFYSKDMILEMMMMQPFSMIIMTLALFSTALTSSYSTRMMYMLMWTPSTFAPLSAIKDSIPPLTTSMMLLTVSAICGGSTLNWIINPLLYEPIMPSMMKLLPSATIIMGICLAIYITKPNSFLTTLLQRHMFTHFFLCSMWLMAPVSTQLILKYPLMSAKTHLSLLDLGWWELFIPKSSYFTITNMTKMFHSLNAITPTNLIMLSAMLTLPYMMFLFCS